MKRTPLVLSILLMFASNAWAKEACEDSIFKEKYPSYCAKKLEKLRSTPKNCDDLERYTLIDNERNYYQVEHPKNTNFYLGQLDDQCLPHGKGEAHSIKSKFVFKGLFAHGKPVKGVELRHDGGVWDGAFVNGKKHGSALGTLPNGAKFTQIWREGKLISNKQVKGATISSQQSRNYSAPLTENYSAPRYAPPRKDPILSLAECWAEGSCNPFPELKPNRVCNFKEIRGHIISGDCSSPSIMMGGKTYWRVN